MPLVLVAYHLPQHDHVAVSKQKVCQVVENIGNGEGNAEAPEFPIGRTSFPLPRWRCTDQGPEGHRPGGDGGNPAVIALFLGQGQDEHQGEPMVARVVTRDRSIFRPAFIS